MSDEDRLQEIERELKGVVLRPAPIQVRHVVLHSIERELRSARWDRRLARLALVLVCVAVAANVTVGWQAHRTPVVADRQRPASQAIAEVADAISTVTDKETARRFEQRLLALRSARQRGKPSAAIRRAIDEFLQTFDSPGKDG